MSRFKMVTEDPMYDEDGLMMDEDAEWNDFLNSIPDLVDQGLAEDLSPFSTINS